MIACCSWSRPLFRLDRALKLTSSYVVSSPVNNFRYAYHGVSCNWTMDKKDSQSSVEQKKKREKIDLVWRPISTQATRFEVKDVTIKSEGTTQVQEVYGSIIGPASIAEKDIAEAEIDVTESVIGSSVPSVDADTESVLYSEKHSISVENCDVYLSASLSMGDAMSQSCKCTFILQDPWSAESCANLRGRKC